MLSRPTSSRSRLDRGKMDKAGYLNLHRYTSDTVIRVHIHISVQHIFHYNKFVLRFAQ